MAFVGIPYAKKVAMPGPSAPTGQVRCPPSLPLCQRCTASLSLHVAPAPAELLDGQAPDSPPTSLPCKTWRKTCRPPCRSLMQLPYILHGENVVGDSGVILDYLVATYGAGAAAVRWPADPGDRAAARDVERTVRGCLTVQGQGNRELEVGL